MNAIIRKIVTVVEETQLEMGQTVSPPTRRAAAIAVIENPFAGRYVEDLSPLVAIGEELGDLTLELSRRGRIERPGDRGGTDGRQGLGLQQGAAYFIAEPELPDLTNPGMEQGFSHGSGSRWFAIYRALLASAR